MKYLSTLNKNESAQIWAKFHFESTLRHPGYKRGGGGAFCRLLGKGELGACLAWLGFCSIEELGRFEKGGWGWSRGSFPKQLDSDKGAVRTASHLSVAPSSCTNTGKPDECDTDLEAEAQTSCGILKDPHGELWASSEAAGSPAREPGPAGWDRPRFLGSLGRRGICPFGVAGGSWLLPPAGMSPFTTACLP